MSCGRPGLPGFLLGTEVSAEAQIIGEARHPSLDSGYWRDAFLDWGPDDLKDLRLWRVAE